MVIDHIIWDWNGTLLDDTGIVVASMNVLLQRRALPLLDPVRYREIFDFPVQAYYEAAGFDLAREPFAVLAEEWIAEFEARWPAASVHADALVAIEALTGHGLTHSILSAAEQQLLLRQVRHFGIEAHFSDIIGIDDHHAVSKVDHGRRWLERTTLGLDNVLLVGDTAHDVEVARSLGIAVVLIADGHQSRPRLLATGAPVLNSAAALPGFVR